MAHTYLFAGLGATLLLAPLALSGGVVPNPVVNGDFELFLPTELAPLEGTPVDECIGIGHQVQFGDDTLQSDLTGGPYTSPDPDNADPVAAVTRLTDDPEGEARFLSGYGNCVWGTGDGYDLAWLNPVRTAQDDAIHWSAENMVGGDWDGDGDREAKIPNGGPGHNMWQAYPSPFQAFTANFDALEFDVDDGAIAPGSLVQISLSTTPLEVQNPWLVIFLDCGLNFPGSALLANMDANGHVAMDPADATLFSRNTGNTQDCDAAAAAWAGASHAERHEILGRLRIVQLSFWSFHTAPNDPSCDCAILIDNVSLTHATTFAEEIAAGNFNVDPQVEDIIGEP